MRRRISIVTLDAESARYCSKPIHLARPDRVAFTQAHPWTVTLF